MPSTTCPCGKVKCEFLAQPVFGLSCFCCDCSERGKYFAEKSNGPVCEMVVARKKPCNLQYFAGKVRITSEESTSDGATTVKESCLAFNRFREGGCTNVCAACCGGVLFVDHKNYAGKLLCVNPAFQNLSSDFEAAPPGGHCWIKDWPEDAYEAYCKKHPIEGGAFYKDHAAGKFVETGPFVPTMDSRKEAAVEQMKELGEGAKSFLELLGDAGGENVVVTLNIAEGASSAKNTLKA